MKLAKSVIEFQKKSENGKKKVKMVWNCQKSEFKVAKSLPHEIFCGKKIQVKKKKIILSQKVEIFW